MGSLLVGRFKRGNWRVTYVILASLDHAQFRKSLIFVAILRGQLRKSAISGSFCHLRTAGGTNSVENPAFWRAARGVARAAVAPRPRS
jgi:hypothetical protein